MSQTPSSDVDDSTDGGKWMPRTIQRIESGLVVALTITGTVFIAPGLWWFPLVVFLVFDVSMLGYMRSSAAGAAWYNVIHNYAWASTLAIIALFISGLFPTASMWLALTALAWAFHVGIDRMLGYGLKLPDAFTHTHLGQIGQASKRIRAKPQLHAT